MAVLVAGGTSGLVWSPVTSSTVTATPAMLGATLAVTVVTVAADTYASRWGAVALWNLNAASGNETDSINGQVLVATNTPGSAAGVVGTARQFNSANSRRFTLTDNATMSTGNIDFWVAAWVYLDSKAALQMVAAKGTSTTAEWGLRYDNTADRLTFYIRGAGGGTVRTATATTLGSPSPTTWYFVVGYHDAITDLVAISVNGSVFDTTATATTAPADAAGAVNVGADPAATTFWDGRIDELAFGKNPPLGIAAVATEIRDRLYNAGAGRAYPWT